MGTIWRAEHLILQAPVAVKLIDRDIVPDDDKVARFLREAKAAAALRSPHVVQILDYGMDEGSPFIVMELLEGENLAQRLKRVGRLSAADTVRIATHVGRAIGRAHEAGIVHRDLKPENVFLVHNEDEEIAKVLDFGVAKIDGLGTEGARTRTGSILGTPYYMSPEQAQGNKAVDHRSDLWSLGVIAFECLTGKRPFWSDGLGDLVLQICVRDIPVPSQVASVPLGFDEWFARAVHREPDQRFQSAREMTDALRDVLGVEFRETQVPAPEIVVATVAASESLPPPSVREASVVPTSTDPAALTVAASPVAVSTERPRATWPETPVPSELPPPAHGGLGSIVAVAAIALGIGLAGGLLLLRGDSDEKAPAALPGDYQSLSEKPRPPAPEPTSSHPSTGRAESVPAAADTAEQAERALASPDAEADPEPTESPERSEDEGEQPEAGSREARDENPRRSNAGSRDRGGRAPSAAKTPPRTQEPLREEPPEYREPEPEEDWVKPEWAIPDGEPRRVEPIEE